MNLVCSLSAYLVTPKGLNRLMVHEESFYYLVFPLHYPANAKPGIRFNLVYPSVIVS